MTTVQKKTNYNGKQVHAILDRLVDAVYQAREGPNEGKVSISAHHQEQLKNLRKVCEEMSASSHKKNTGAGSGIPQRLGGNLSRA